MAGAGASTRTSRRHALASTLGGALGLAGCAVAGGRQPAAPPPVPAVQSIATTATSTTAVEVGPIYGVHIDAAQRLRSISPLIYGLAGSTATLRQKLRSTLERWGGNPSSRYNWQLGNAWNAARDWEFRNGNDGNTSAADRQPSGVADQAIASNKASGAATLLTIPALGWVAKDDNNDSRSLTVPQQGGAGLPGRPDGAIAGYDPSANRARTSVPSLARSAAGAPDGAVFQDAWIRHLVERFSDAAHGGVQFYAIDNEPDLWAETHTDVHPARLSYDMTLSAFLTYATMIKEVDPTAQVTGPVLSGWTAYYYSALDRADDSFRAAADRKAHGGTPFLIWWLQQVRAHDEQAGKRSLDVLDVHYYPQGGEYPSGNDAETSARRLRSTRSLWDPTYVDESWINRTYDEGGKKGIVRLIPRLRDWVAQYYPDTKIGITEWNWGADDTPNGALAISEVLGIFGREGVDLAAYWQAPREGSPGAIAFQAYRNYDGNGSQFGDTALLTSVTDADRLSCFASTSSTGDVTAVLLNKDPVQPARVSLRIANFQASATLTGYQYAGAGPAGLTALPVSQLADNGAALTLPPTSITVLLAARQS